MSIWKVGEEGPAKVDKTDFHAEEVLEDKLEDWIASDPDLLGEPLLIIGRQTRIPDINDRIDLLALDPQGNAVIVELKRGKLKDPVDMQALRYASYVSKWTFEDFEKRAISHYGKAGDPEFNFNEIFEQFCLQAGVDDVPDINQEQRIIIVGSEVREKLGSVALWLREHQIDINVIELNAYKDNGELFLEPRTIIPLPVSRFEEVGRGGLSEPSRPWLTSGQEWHLEKRCSPVTRDIFVQLNDIIQDSFEVDGPRWGQKFYVAYRIGSRNWLTVNTRATMLRLRFQVRAGEFRGKDLADELGIEIFNIEESLEEKIGLPSSILVQNRNETSDRVTLRIKKDFDLNSDQFGEFLKRMYQAFPE